MSEPIVIYECPECGSLDVDRTRCESLPDHDRRRAAVPMVRQQDIRLTEDESNGLHSALNAAQHFKVLSDSRVDALRARVDAGFVDGPSWEQVRPLWEAALTFRRTTGASKLTLTDGRIEGDAAIAAFRAPEAWTERADDEPDEDPEPSGDQIYNGHGMEGGIPCPTGEMRDENDGSL